MEVKNMIRVFTVKAKGNDVTLPDPNPSMTTLEVLKFYSGKYPEITNANVTGPTVKDDKAHFTFNPTVGQKG